MIRTFLLVVALLVSNCTAPNVELTSPVLPARDLAPGAFPPGWQASTCEPDCSRSEGHTEAYRSFYIEGAVGNATQDVQRLESSVAAETRFQNARATQFQKSNRFPSTEYRPWPEISYSSPIADEFYVACGIDVVSACRSIARYDRYYIALYFDIKNPDRMDEDGMTFAEVESILRAMDELVIERFDLPPDQRADVTGQAAIPVRTRTPFSAASVADLDLMAQTGMLEERVNAIYALGSKGVAAEPAIVTLISVLDDPNPEVRLASASALGRLHSIAHPAVATLVRVLINDPIPDVRQEAAKSLGHIGELASVPFLAQALYDSDVVVPRQAAEALVEVTGVGLQTRQASGQAFDENGQLWILRSAKEWWLSHGQDQEWPPLQRD